MNKLYYLLLLTVFFIPFVFGLGYIQNLSTNFTGYSISNDYYSNSLFIEGNKSMENVFGTGHFYGKYSLIYSNYSAYDDKLVGHINFSRDTIPTEITGSDIVYWNSLYQGYVRFSDKYIRTSEYELLATSPESASSQLYAWNPSYSYWNVVADSNTRDMYLTGGFHSLDSTYRGKYNLGIFSYTTAFGGYRTELYNFYFYNVSSYYLNETYPERGNWACVPYKVPIDADTNTQFVTSCITFGFDWSRTLSNGFFNDMRTGWMNKDNTLFYSLTPSSIYVSTDKYNLNVGYVDVKASIPSCAAIMTTNYQLYDMSCRSSTDCLVVGYENYNKSLVFAFNGINCYKYDVEAEIGGGFNATNRPLYNNEYNYDTEKYYAVGQNAFYDIYSLTINESAPPVYTEPNYTINVTSDNFFLKSGNTIITDSEKYNTDLGVIYAYPQGNDGDAVILDYTIDSQYNGFTKTVCAASSGTDDELIMLDFNNCSSSFSCGLLPSPSFFNWDTAERISAFDKSLIIYNAFAFSKYFYSNDVFNSGYNNFRVYYDYFGGIGSSTVFSLVNPTNNEFVNIFMDVNDTDVCYYTATTSSVFASKTLLYCGKYVYGIPSENNIYYNSQTNNFYIISRINNTLYSSDNIMSNDFGINQLSGFQINSISESNETFIDNIGFYGIANENNLTYHNMPYVTSCAYNLYDCYTTKIYFAYENNDFTNYRTFYVCALTKTNVTDIGIDITPIITPSENDTGIYIDLNNPSTRQNLPTSSKLFLLFVAAAFIFFICWYGGKTVNMPEVGVTLGLVFTIMLLIAAAIPDFPLVGGFIPAWFAIMMLLIALIIGVFLGIKGFTREA